MKKAVILFLAFLHCGQFLSAQDIIGHWNGILSVQGTNLRLVFHINKNGDAYTSTMDSPDQGVMGIPVGATAFDGSNISLAIPAFGFLYEGEFKTDSITGTVKQSGFSFPVTLKRTADEVKPLIRPQEPKPPYPYRSEELTFDNKAAGITLAGTLTMPATGSNFTAAILITGSGAQDRNEEIAGHKPFLVIADYLAQRGIAVLRFDDRGTAQSTGDYNTATTADLASDVESAIACLKTRPEINRQKIGLIGHSEGGIIAPMVATHLDDVAFIVMLAGPGLRGDALLLLQEEAIYKASGTPENFVAGLLKINAKVFDKIAGTNEFLSRQALTDYMTTLKTDIIALFGNEETADNYIRQFVAGISNLWMQYFLRYDPAPALEKVKCPVLAVNGSKDVQVLAKENLTAIGEALRKGGNTNVTVREYPGLNHLFQECATGLPAEYAAIEQTFSPAVLKDLGDWIISR
jgi:pimeloyl-ACP methyl ester carboxylesterase